MHQIDSSRCETHLPMRSHVDLLDTKAESAAILWLAGW